ncbi:MAG: crossover junction endodeoxyribonuclease RuvC [Bacillota bacterium]
MLVMGVDPGTALTGYGLVREGKGSKLVTVCYGYFTTDADWSLARRLQAIYHDVTRVITEFKPDAVAIEDLFFNKNARTVMAVAYGRGMTLLAAAEADCPVFEYSPPAVKRAVTGMGRATKEQVKYMVQRLLGLETPLSPDDVADALAVAICHLHNALTTEVLAFRT